MIRCEVSAHTLDLTAHWPLYQDDAPTPRIALRWMQERARRLADHLDPDPLTTTWAHLDALRPVSIEIPDAPTHIRLWAGSDEAQDDVLNLLSVGQAVSLSAHDDTAHYTFTAIPRQFRVPPWAPGPPALTHRPTTNLPRTTP